MHSCIKVHFFGIAAPWLSSLLPLYVTAVRNSCYSRRQGLLRLVAVVTISHEDRPTGFAYANTTVSPRRTAARWWHFAMRSFRLIAGDANRRADPHTSAPRKPLAPAVLKDKEKARVRECPGLLLSNGCVPGGKSRPELVADKPRARQDPMHADRQLRPSAIARARTITRLPTRRRPACYRHDARRASAPAPTTPQNSAIPTRRRARNDLSTCKCVSETAAKPWKI
jgi:hypothetical protein